VLASPSTSAKPAPHVAHAVARAAEYCPTLQLVHADSPGTAPDVPAAQSKQSDAASLPSVGRNVPAAQSMQSDASSLPA
jgi:hypothetical protein